MLRKLAFTRVFLVVVGVVIGLVLLEIGLRVIFATKVGPNVLLFGTRYCCGPKEHMAIDSKGIGKSAIEKFHTVHVQELINANYQKYEPNQWKHDYTTDGDTFVVRINNHGFRGNDFSLAKGEGVVRVVTLGASSTFGYTARDHETYPVFMEELLNRRLANSGCHGVKSFEVINLGIPHLWTGNILALFAIEGIPLNPDVVTLYAGMNDAKPAWGPRDRPNEYKLIFNQNNIDSKPWLLQVAHYRLILGLRDYLITAALVDNLINVDYTTFSAGILEEYSPHKVEEFLNNVAAMHSLAEKAGATLIVANQQAHHSDYKLPVKDVTYLEEAGRLSEKLQGKGELSLRELEFMTHHRLMERLEPWCKENGVPFVDVIRALDPRRDLMSSYVHLTPAANRIVSEAFADKVWAQTCRFEGATTN